MYYKIYYLKNNNFINNYNYMNIFHKYIDIYNILHN